MGRGSGRRNFGPLFQYAQFRPCMVELTSQLGSQTGSRGLNGTWQWAFACCFMTRNFGYCVYYSIRSYTIVDADASF